MYKILICDDERDIRNALRIYLTGEGYAVCEADSGLAALELMQREEVQLVLMDIMMPGMDGMTATAKLREQSNVPVILITAKSEPVFGCVYKLVAVEDKDGNVTEEKIDDEYYDVPMAVLVNGYSASASEILAGAIRDNHAGLLVGTKTFGKGVVQSSLEFADGSGMKVTTARYYTPSGECIHEIGIEPDVEVELDEDAVTRYGINNLPHDHDAQLQKAIELLGGTPVLTTATPDEADAAEEK